MDMESKHLGSGYFLDIESTGFGYGYFLIIGSKTLGFGFCLDTESKTLGFGCEFGFQIQKKMDLDPDRSLTPLVPEFPQNFEFLQCRSSNIGIVGVIQNWKIQIFLKF